MSSEKNGKKWYYAENKDRKGPFSQEQLIDLIQTGTITGATLIWTQGFDKWCKAAETEMAVHLQTVQPNDVPPPVPTKMSSVIDAVSNLKTNEKVASVIGAVSELKVKEKVSSVVDAVSELKVKEKVSSVVDSVSNLKNNEKVSSVIDTVSDLKAKAFSNKRPRLIGILVLCAALVVVASLVRGSQGPEKKFSEVRNTSQQSTGTASNTEGWEADNQSQEEITNFVISKIITEAVDFLDEYTVSIYPLIGRAPEIEVTVNGPENEFVAEVLEYVMDLVKEYFKENKIDASEIDVHGTFKSENIEIGRGYYINDGSFEWESSIIAYTPPTVQAPSQQEQTQQTRRIIVTAVNEASVISQPDSTGRFRFNRVCGRCGWRRESSMFASVGTFSDSSFKCSGSRSCSNFIRSTFRGELR